MNNQLKFLLGTYFFTGILIFFIVMIRTFFYDKFLKDIIVFYNIKFFTISHFIMYFLLGYYASKYWYISFILSILWEYFEIYLSKKNIKISGNLEGDIFVNTMGLLLGMYLRKYIKF